MVKPTIRGKELLVQNYFGILGAGETQMRDFASVSDTWERRYYSLYSICFRSWWTELHYELAQNECPDF